MKIGRYKVIFSLKPFCWIQTSTPITIRRFLFWWIVKEALPTDIDKTQQFPEGTVMIKDGKTYRYWKANKSYKEGEVVTIDENNL